MAEPSLAQAATDRLREIQRINQPNVSGAATWRSNKLDDDERMAAMMATFVDQAGFGVGEYPLASLMSLLPGRGTFNEELTKAHDLQRRLALQEPGSHAAIRFGTLFTPGGASRTLSKAYRAARNSAGRFGLMMNTLGNLAYDFGEGPGRANIEERRALERLEQMGQK